MAPFNGGLEIHAGVFYPVTDGKQKEFVARRRVC
jgi:hypothetical protein